MSDLVTLAAGCLLASRTVALTPDGEGWRERVSYEVVAEPSCAWVDLFVPANTTLTPISGRAQRESRSNVHFDDARWDVLSPRRADGSGEVRVLLTDLEPGDRAFFTVERGIPSRDYTWCAADGQPRWAEIAAPGVRLELEGLTRARKGGWASLPGPGARAWVGEPRPCERPIAAVPRRVNGHLDRMITIDVPDPDPLRGLWPGGGSSWTGEDSWTFAAGPATEVLVPLPPGAEVVHLDGLKGEAREDAVLLKLPASSQSRDVLVTWTAPDAPAFGEVRWELPPSWERRGLVDASPIVDAMTLYVNLPDGRVVWDETERFWKITRLHDRPVVPDRAQLLAALRYRFDGQSMPEPGLANGMRAGRTSTELAELLRDALLLRAVPTAVPVEAQWPRSLYNARAQGMVGPVEAALIVTLYARQLRIPADWVLVRPATLGPAPGDNPAGFTEALVRIQLDGEERWIDPSCAVCGPFELRPELEGASALAFGVDLTPPPTPGKVLVVEREDESWSWTLEGPPAQFLRRWLAALPEGTRNQALADRLGGEGATLIRHEGIDVGGAPIVVELTPGTPIDALAVADRLREGPLKWVGERRLESTIPVDAVTMIGPGWYWVRRPSATGHVVLWAVTERTATDLPPRPAERFLP